MCVYAFVYMHWAYVDHNYLPTHTYTHQRIRLSPDSNRTHIRMQSSCPIATYAWHQIMLTNTYIHTYLLTYISIVGLINQPASAPAWDLHIPQITAKFNSIQAKDLVRASRSTSTRTHIYIYIIYIHTQRVTKILFAAVYEHTLVHIILSCSM